MPALLEEERHTTGPAADVEHAPACKSQGLPLGFRPAPRRSEVRAGAVWTGIDVAVVTLDDLDRRGSFEVIEDESPVGVLAFLHAPAAARARTSAASRSATRSSADSSPT